MVAPGLINRDEVSSYYGSRPLTRRPETTRLATRWECYVQINEALLSPMPYADRSQCWDGCDCLILLSRDSALPDNVCSDGRFMLRARGGTYSVLRKRPLIFYFRRLTLTSRSSTSIAAVGMHLVHAVSSLPLLLAAQFGSLAAEIQGRVIL